MKRRDFIKVTGLGVAGAATIAAPAIAQSMPEIKWRMTASWPKSLDTLYGGAEMMCKAVAEATDNKFQIQTFRRRRNRARPAGARCRAERHRRDGPYRVVLLLRQGSDLRLRHVACRSGPTRASIRAGTSIGGGKEVLNEFYKNYNVTSLLAGNTGCQMGGWFRKEIKTVADLNGLKFRIGGFAGKVLQKLGVVPQQLAGGDIYPALEKGTIDAAEWVGPYDDEKLGFNKIAPHYYYPGWWEGGPMLLAYRQSRQVERAAEALSGRARAGRRLRQQLDDGEIRPASIRRR